MDFANLLSGINPASMRGKAADLDLADSSEKVIVSTTSLIKMIKHGRAGVPMEVMGLMLGEFVDQYTTRVVDVFSMPQSGNSVSVEAVDPAYQAEMLEMLNRTGRPEMVVGWYHSHPGFGCWFSGTDINTQTSFEQLNSRAVGIVVDPIQSVKGKVVIDCFRLINVQQLMLHEMKEPRQHTGNSGLLVTPSVSALVHGLDRNYYSIIITFEKTPEETAMLLNMDKKTLQSNLELPKASEQKERFTSCMADLKKLTASFHTSLEEELETDDYEKLLISRVGKLDPVKRLRQLLEEQLHTRTLEGVKRSAAALLF
eukprot:GHVH01017432.1.p1 GENE.GHVH01017432.1~~GHVH01017432.1.p1  ORF type:complete len:313 (+),score=47.65 GHVH01017432.1:104-1042(+)